MENVGKHRDIKLVTINRRRSYVVSETNYHTVKQFPESLLAKELRKVEVKRKKPVYLGLSILEINKTLMHEFWYDYINIKYQNNAKLRYMDTDSFMVHIQTEDVYKNTDDDVGKRFDMLNYTIIRPLPKGKKETD